MYDTIYKLKCAPFALDPDPNFFFNCNAQRQDVIRLRAALEQCEPLVAVVAEYGMGKTQLLQQFRADLELQEFTTIQFAPADLHSQSLLQYLANSAGVHLTELNPNDPALEVRIVLGAQASREKSLLLLIDDAHLLNGKSLAELWQLGAAATRENLPMRCIVFGEKALLHNLRHWQSSHTHNALFNTGNYIELDALSSTETPAYIEHRLLKAGWQGQPRFNSRSYELIHKLTNGVPHKINQLCTRLLERARLEQIHEIDDAFVSRFQCASSWNIAGSCATPSAGNTAAAPSGESQSSAPAVQPDADARLAPQQVDAHTSLPETAKPAFGPVSNFIDFARDSYFEDAQPPLSLDDIETALNEIYDISESTAPRVGNSNLATELNIQPLIGNHTVKNDNDDAILATDYAEIEEIYASSLVAQEEMSTPIENTAWSSSATANEEQQTLSLRMHCVAASGPDTFHDATPTIQSRAAAYFSRKSAVTIAVSASIATSLLITAAIWILGPRNNASQPTELDRSNATPRVEHKKPNTVAPNPFIAFSDFVHESPHIRLPTLPPSPRGKLSSTSGAKSAITSNKAAGNLDDYGTTRDFSAIPFKGHIDTQSTPMIPPIARSSTKPTLEYPLTDDKFKTRAKASRAAGPQQAIAKRDSNASKSASWTGAGTRAPISLTANRHAGSFAGVDEEGHSLSGFGASDNAGLNQTKRHNAPSSELNTLLHKLSGAYENGDLRQFLSFFAQDAKTNKAKNRRELEQDYRLLFDVTDMRKMSISNMRWSQNNNQMSGQAAFKLLVREKGDNRVLSYNGTLYLKVENGPSGVTIKHLDYNYQ